MSEHTFRVGIIGVGGIADQHVLGYQAAGATIVAIADISEDALATRRAAWNVADSYTNYHELLARDGIQAVSICTPNAFHAPMAIAAAKAGKHVLCEKPISMDLASARDMIAVCQAEGVVLQIGHHLRSAPAPAKAKALIGAGVIGKVTFVRLRQAHDWGGAERVKGVFGLKQYSGGGTMLDNGCHMMDLARYFAGDVVRVFAQTATLKFPEIDVEDTSLASLTFASGALGSVENAWTATGFEEGFWIYGTKGSLEFTNRTGDPKLICHTRSTPRTNWSETDITSYSFCDGRGHVAQGPNFVAACLGQRGPICTGEDGLEAVRLVLAGYESADKGMPITLRPEH